MSIGAPRSVRCDRRLRSPPPRPWSIRRRQRVHTDRLISRWFTILDEADLVPKAFRPAATGSTGAGQVDRWNDLWRSDEFVLDPTRVTLYIANTGLNGFEFREDVLMGRFRIQINKTSINACC